MAPKLGVADRERFTVLDGMLLRRRAGLRSWLRTLREAVPAEREQGEDPAEQGVVELAVHVDVTLAEMESATLRQIDEAIERLHEGTYGYCAECDQAVSEARLEALPFARLCRECQERQEGEATRERSLLALEEGLSISARNDRTPPRLERQQARIWQYARAATSRALAAREAARAESPLVKAMGLARRGVSRAPIAARASRRG